MQEAITTVYIIIATGCPQFVVYWLPYWVQGIRDTIYTYKTTTCSLGFRGVSFTLTLVPAVDILLWHISIQWMERIKNEIKKIYENDHVTFAQKTLIFIQFLISFNSVASI